MSKNVDTDKYSYSGYGIGFETRGTFSLSDSSEFRKNVIIFGVDHNSSSASCDHSPMEKNILVFGKG